MTALAALTGLPLLAVLVATYVGVVLLLARACGTGGRREVVDVELVEMLTCDDPRLPVP